jgi:hypothetical protein
MIERRYVGVQTAGRAAQVLERIRQVVRSSDQTHAIPVIKVEKKPRGQFYIFLAIDGVEGSSRLPGPIAQVLRMAGLTGRQFWPLSLAEIKSMVATAEVETYGFSSLSYKPLWDRDVGDPYDLSDDTDFPETGVNDPVLAEKYNRLLYWLSATAEGTWEGLVRTCVTLGLADHSNKARRIMRRLMLLGHIECSKDGSAWMIAPLAFVSSLEKANMGFLSGQRTPKLLTVLMGFGILTECSQPRDEGPSRIEISCASLAGGALEIAPGIVLQVVGAASERLAELLPDLQGWKATLASIDKLNTANCLVERWDGRIYVSCPDFYERGNQYFGAPGLYRLTREANSYRTVLYFDSDQQKWLKGDWYGLRFLAYKAAQQQCKAVYRVSTNELLIPADQRWPMLYERALVLASGQLPRVADNHNWLAYEGISYRTAQTLTHKLSALLEER